MCAGLLHSQYLNDAYEAQMRERQKTMRQLEFSARMLLSTNESAAVEVTVTEYSGTYAVRHEAEETIYERELVAV